jgi:blue copper oxidase
MDNTRDLHDSSGRENRAPSPIPGRAGLLGILSVSLTTPFQLTTQRASVELVPGRAAQLLVYRAEQAGNTFLNPSLVVQRDTTLAVDLLNQLDEGTTIHWHGLDVEWTMDGHPLHTVAPGATYQYQFVVRNRGGTYWYHSHAHEHTAQQVYRGLAGFLLVEDEEQRRLARALDLTLGETDIPLLLQDKFLDAQGQISYPTDTESQAMGVEGTTILTNLTINPILEVATRLYRFRLLNGSNARIFRLAFLKQAEHESLPFWIIGTGSLLDRPHQVKEAFLAPGERVDVLLDIVPFAAGEMITLKSLAFDPMHHEMSMEMPMGGMDMDDQSSTHERHAGMNAPALASGQAFSVLQLLVRERVPYDRVLPASLATIEPVDIQGATTRSFTLSVHEDGPLMHWLINGLTFVLEEDPIVVRKDMTEVWEIRNEARSMPHPMHLHGFQFQVVDRVDSPGQVASLRVDDTGRMVTDLGWKDTVLVWPGETVRLAIHFSHPYPSEQRYLFHCHILEHEDTGMMLNCKVV